MKKSELKQLIKEEIKNIMNTKDDGALRPTGIEIQFTEKGRYYNITADGKDVKDGVFGIGVKKAEEYLESITGMEEIDLLYVKDEMLDEITKNLKNKGIKFTWREDMSVD